MHLSLIAKKLLKTAKSIQFREVHDFRLILRENF
jgi:hypothetical protein